MRFVEMISFHAAANPERPAIVLADRVVTYGMLGRGVRSIEDRLEAASLAKGDIVGILVDNPVRHIALVLALYRLGLVSVSLTAGTEAATARFGLKAILVEQPAFLGSGLRTIHATDDWFAGRSDVQPIRRETNFGENEDCRIMLSSGTTGEPRPVWFTASTIERRMVAYTLAMAGGNWQRMQCAMGLSTAWGFCAAMATLWGGKTVCFAASARETLQMISLYRADLLVCSPQQIRAFLESQDEQYIPCDSLRRVSTGGSAFSWDLIAAAQAKLCSRIELGYGSTETGRTAFAPAERLVGTDGATGIVAPWATIEAVDEDGETLPAGKEGIIRIRTPNQGRWDDSPARSVAASPELPWFYPGDLGVVHPDGRLVITGRVSEVINFGGVKMAPEPLERILLSHPHVGDAAVAGIVGADGIEEIWAAIVPRQVVDEQELIAYCAQRLPGAALRRVRVAAAIPRNENGKIVRRRVRDMLTA